MKRLVLIRAAAVAVLFLAVVFVIVRWRARDYEAVSLIRVHRAGVDAETDQGVSTAGYEVFKQTNAVLLGSPFVCSAALRRPGIEDLPWIRKQNDATMALSNALEVRTPEDTEIISISLRGPDKDDTKRLLDAVVIAYFDEVVEADRARQLADLDQLRATSRDVREQIKEKLDQLTSLEQKYGNELRNAEWRQRRVESLDDRLLDLDIAIVQAGNDEEQVTKLNAAKAVVTSKLDEVQSQPARVSPDVEIYQIDLSNLRDVLAQTEAKIFVGRSKSAPQIQVLQRAHVPNSALALW